MVVGEVESVTETPEHLRKHNPSCYISTFCFLLSAQTAPEETPRLQNANDLSWESIAGGTGRKGFVFCFWFFSPTRAFVLVENAWKVLLNENQNCKLVYQRKSLRNGNYSCFYLIFFNPCVKMQMPSCTNDFPTLCKYPALKGSVQRWKTWHNLKYEREVSAIWPLWSSDNTAFASFLSPPETIYKPSCTGQRHSHLCIVHFKGPHRLFCLFQSDLIPNSQSLV